MKKSVLLVGCGKVGYKLALELEREGYDVSVVERDPGALQKLENDGFSGLTVQGIPIDTNVLERAGIESCDVLATVTSDDNTNIMVSQLAREFYNIERIVTRVQDPERERVYEYFGLDTVCSTNLAVAAITSALLEPEETAPVTLGNNSFVFKRRSTDASMVGKKLSEISVRTEEMIFGILRSENQKMEFFKMGTKQMVKEGDVLVLAKMVD